jgi:hypothetical protein
MYVCILCSIVSTNIKLGISPPGLTLDMPPLESGDSKPLSPFKLRRFRIDSKSGHWKLTAVFDSPHNHQVADKSELQLLQLISNTDQAKLMAKTSQ